jgi:phosphoserine / homoserine phosphotransferase
MYITCLDLEGVLVPEIWIAVSKACGIPELSKTTRDEPDYDKLMRWRIGVLKEYGLGLPRILQTITQIDPLPGARGFLDTLRQEGQVVIISDTFTQFASPLMQKLGWPTLFCNELEVAPSGEITGYTMRLHDAKRQTVRALQAAGYQTIASGDGYNDIAMIEASSTGFLFRTTRAIEQAYPHIRSCTRYDELLDAIREAVRSPDVTHHRPQ